MSDIEAGHRAFGTQIVVILNRNHTVAAASGKAGRIVD